MKIKNESIRYLKGVGPRKEKLLREKADISDVFGLLSYFPFRYEDRGSLGEVKNLKENEPCLIKAKVVARKLKKFPQFMRRSKIKSIFEVILDDSTGKINCVWFNQAYLAESIQVGQKLFVYGKPSCYKGRLQLVAPKFEPGNEPQLLDVGKIVPIYRLPAGISQRYFRKIIFLALKQYCRNFIDPIPFTIRKKENILNIAKSFQQIHFPGSWEEAKLARQRFIFEELFMAQIRVYLRKAKHRLQKGPSLKINNKAVEEIKKVFIFEFTLAQKKALEKIISDLNKNYPMRRLLQGEVGSGKTAVAIFPILLAALSGWQSAFMVPTEVLAYQHKQTMDDFLGRGGSFFNFLKGKIELLTSSLSPKDKSEALSRLGSGKSLVAIGTHSLIQKDLHFKKLAVVVIDEQHKFGVAQRALLPQKGKVPPDCLIMSATPIPRSLALSLYGDLDFSVINQLPPGRQRPETLLVKEKNRNWVYNLIEEKIKQGRQAYLVYPVIDSGEQGQGKSLSQMYEKIKKRFSHFSLAIFHGRLKNWEKVAVIEKFKKKEIDILVATNVVEVGLNIKNATIMVVESPQKFGLSQLHQLRGRIQRSSQKATFIMLYQENISQEAKKRLAVIKKENDGFKIAEADLNLRGPGDFFGQIQHGLPNLKIADPRCDLEILKKARQQAKEVVAGSSNRENLSTSFLREHFQDYFSQKVFSRAKK